MSSLASQLKQSASLNASLLADRSKRKPIESYLFTGREANQQDLDSIYALGTNAFLKLCLVDQRFRRFEYDLFSDRARAIDRTLLGQEDDKKLSDCIGQFLGLLGPWILDAPAASVIEWFVRRFRVHEFDVENLLEAFLPYHDTAQFAKLVSILQIKPSSTWSFLLPFKSAAQHVPRVSLVTEMLRNTDVARFVTSILPSALQQDRSHRVLLAFNAATLHEFISRSKSFDEGTMAYLLPAVLEPLESRHGRDAILGSFILLSTLSRKCELSASALRAIVGSMAACADAVATKQFMSAITAVCAPQTELDTFSSSTVKAIFKLPDFKEELRAIVNWAGAEKVLRPIITASVLRLSDTHASALLEAVISTPAAPSAVIEHMTTLLIKEALVEENAEKANIAHSLLSSLHQRYPGAFQCAIKTEQDDDEDFRQAIDQLILSLSMVSTMGTKSKGKGDMVSALSDGDVNVRLIAVKKLLSSLSDPSLTSQDKGSITTALISRIQDPEQRILEVLYEKSDVIGPLFASEAASYIQLLSASLESKPKRSVLRLHLAFLLGQLYPYLESRVKEQVISEILFPFLLFSKPRQHTAETVWDLVAEFMGGDMGKEFEMLKSCADVIKVEREKSGQDVVEKLRIINSALCAKIAQNLLTSNRLFEYLPTMLSKIESTNSYTRTLGYLITKALLSKLSGQHLVDVAIKLLQVMKLEGIDGIQDLPPENEVLLENLATVPEKHVVLKPTKRSTLCWLQASLIASISAICAPDGLSLNWLSHQATASIEDDRGPKYVGLMRATYNLINRSSSPPVVTSCLLHIFFSNLKTDALIFLAGVWMSEAASTLRQDHALLQEIALRHAAAFLEAHVLENDGVDFQTIVPAVLVALQNHVNSVRVAAVECLRRIRLISEKKLKSVYKFDVIYGDVKDSLQYLLPGDLKRYLAYLVAQEQHFTHDYSYIRVAHAEHLTPVKGERKKDAEYKNNILHCLLSHVNALSIENVQVKILESLSLVSSSIKAISLLPSINTLQNGQGNAVLATLLVSSIDAASAPDLNDTEEGLWEIYIQVLKLYLRPSSDPEPREVLIRLLETELFWYFTSERQVSASQAVINTVARDPDAQIYGKKLLSSILNEVPLIVELLNIQAPISRDNTPRAAKRLKTTDTNERDDTLSELSLLAEILGSKPLPGSLNLVSVLLETLNKLIQYSLEPQADVNYVEQMLMSAIDNAACNILETPNITPHVIRLDVLVEVIRVAENPQTFHQALLLMASLARLAPESVLHNVMPVFTFMGSNVFHRDDTYSFRVVQKTIDGIVPVMASSLKGAHANSLDLYIASRDFLRVFTDAGNHIPRHRRNKFFAHLVEVLGTDHFLAPICMLLAEKSTNRVVKRKPEETSSTLSLPVALLQHVSPTIRISALLEFSKESKRLASHASNPTDHSLSLLGYAVDGDATVISSTYLKRAQVLATLIGEGILPNTFVNLDENGKEMLSSLVSGLIELTVANNSNETKSSGLAAAAQRALNKVLAAIPAFDFVQAILLMLGSDNTIIHIGALELLSERIPKISNHVRQEVVTTINGIVDCIVKVLAQDNVLQRIHCLKALAAIALTLVPKEETTMAAALSTTLVTLRVPELTLHALDVIIPLSTKLGPRIIPFFKNIITVSIDLLKDADDVLLDKTTAVLEGLLTSIPAFWGSDAITQIINLYINHCKYNSGHPKAAMTSLLRSTTKKVPSKVLLPNLMDIWPTVTPSQNLDRITAYFEFLSRTLRQAPRVCVLEHVRVLSNIFLQAFDAVKVSDLRADKAEKAVILAYRELVVKLNESIFRPVFRRLYDWAFVEGMADNARRIIFFHTYCDLLDFFKALVVPYTSFLLPAFHTYLNGPVELWDDSFSLWVSLLDTLKRTLLYDDGSFWGNDKLKQIATPLIQQVPQCVNFPADSEAKELLQQCLDALVEDVFDDALLKSINLSILMHTRSENPQVRHFALVCSELLWRAHHGKLIGFIPETATFITECGEDENDIVVRESFRLKEVIEGVAGKIDGL